MFKKSFSYVGFVAATVLTCASLAGSVRAADPFFFKTQVSLGNNWFYSPDFGYFNTSFYSEGSTFLFKSGFGFLYCFGDDGNNGAYFYDFGSKTFLYTNAGVYEYPDAAYFYHFALGAWTYHFEDTDDSNLRAFFDFSGNVVFMPAN